MGAKRRLMMVVVYMCHYTILSRDSEGSQQRHGHQSMGTWPLKDEDEKLMVDRAIEVGMSLMVSALGAAPLLRHIFGMAWRSPDACDR